MVKRKQSSTSQGTWLPWLIISGLILFMVSGALLYRQPTTYVDVIPPQVDFAGLDGSGLYQANCASCHGVNLEGQMNWKVPGENGVLLAPPHDNSGHTWHHADDLLLQIIAEGGSMPNSTMPAYQDRLTEAEMTAILAYIKTYWGHRELAFQAEVTQRGP